jgi:hypothetical protein
MQIQPMAPPTRLEARSAPTAGNASEPKSKSAPPAAFVQVVRSGPFLEAKASIPVPTRSSTIRARSDQARMARERSITG